MSLDENARAGNATTPRVARLPAPAPALELWWCELRATPDEIESYAALLSPSEHARAARFGMPLLRDRYVTGRAALRGILSRILAVDAAAVPIVRGPRGRPQLAEGGDVDFNVSHTHDVALFGVLHDARAARIGVDVERLDRRINAPGVARKFLSEREREALSTLDAEQARRQVLALWTCKEAMSKATGDALSAPFSRIDIDVARTPTVRAGPGVYRPGPWTLHRAGLQDRYVATVAIWRR